jgi:histidine triad (HIT) family protein
VSASRPKRERSALPEGCVFCRIAAGKAPAWVVYEDSHAIAFLDTRPIAPGHILVCPKAHSERLTEMEELASLTTALKKVAHMVEEKLAPDYNIGANQGALAGQVVFHHHWHVIPRYEGERQDFWTRMVLTDEMAKEILGKLGVKQKRRG